MDAEAKKARDRENRTRRAAERQARNAEIRTLKAHIADVAESVKVAADLSRLTGGFPPGGQKRHGARTIDKGYAKSIVTATKNQVLALGKEVTRLLKVHKVRRDVRERVIEFSGALFEFFRNLPADEFGAAYRDLRAAERKTTAKKVKSAAEFTPLDMGGGRAAPLKILIPNLLGLDQNTGNPDPTRNIGYTTGHALASLISVYISVHDNRARQIGQPTIQWEQNGQYNRIEGSDLGRIFGPVNWAEFQDAKDRAAGVPPGYFKFVRFQVLLRPFKSQPPPEINVPNTQSIVAGESAIVRDTGKYWLFYKSQLPHNLEKARLQKIKNAQRARQRSAQRKQERTSGRRVSGTRRSPRR